MLLKNDNQEGKIAINNDIYISRIYAKVTIFIKFNKQRCNHLILLSAIINSRALLYSSTDEILVGTLARMWSQSFDHNQGDIKTWGSQLENEDSFVCEKLTSEAELFFMYYSSSCYCCLFFLFGLMKTPLNSYMSQDFERYFGLQLILEYINLEEHEFGSSCQLNGVAKM